MESTKPTDDSADRRDPLDRPAKLEPFYDLADSDVFPADKLGRVEELIEDSSWVPEWLSRALLLFGLTLLVVGVVFFFAFNWDELPDLAKLGLIQVGFAGALAAGTLRSLRSVTSRVLLVVAGVLVGVFLGVFGQVYQTGADAWQLFALWAAILLPLAALTGTQGAWVLFGVVASLAGITGFEELIPGSQRSLRAFAQTMSVVLTSGAVLATTEWLRREGAGLVEDFPWSRPILLSTGFGALTFEICLYEEIGVGSGVLATSVFLLVAASFAVVYFYTEYVPDIAASAVVGLSLLVVSLRFLFEWVFRLFDEESLAFMIMAALTLALTAALVAVLRKLHQRLADAEKEAS